MPRGYVSYTPAYVIRIEFRRWWCSVHAHDVTYQGDIIAHQIMHYLSLN